MTAAAQGLRLPRGATIWIWQADLLVLPHGFAGTMSAEHSTLTPEELITVVVQPDVQAALATPNDLRGAFHVCAGIEALASAIYNLLSEAGATTYTRDSHYKQALEPRSEAFAIIHAAAEAFKHGVLTSRPRPVVRADAIVSREHGWGVSPWGEMMWDVDRAIAIDIDGVIRTIAPIAATALEFLQGELLDARALITAPPAAPSATP